MNNIGWIIIVFILWFIKHEELMPLLLNLFAEKERVSDYANRNILK